MSEQPWAGHHGGVPPVGGHGYTLTIPPRRRRPWLWIALGTVLAVLAGTLVWLVVDTAPDAPPAARGEVGQTKVVTATDGHSKLTIPVDWEELPDEYQAEGATLTYGQIFQERYLMMFTDEKSDFDDFADYEDSAVMLMADLPSEATRVGEREPIRVGGLSGARYEVTGTFDGEPCVFWFTLVEGDRRYYHLMTWTLAARKDTAGPALAKVVDSFQESP
ncbi:hypothetical protein [Actinokineospora cianjurensis]|uniref:Alanine and proline-rich secreted protein Apa n=1 Tax=Actinokineospora cianjurensis TaxID=585224 RepID=A0A421B6M5_9PSEU|nr:hypothetical protein [Actinokineospora cianjurensis]RLK59945.1 hypothetical protein CLV68_0435 [Actinokineospora cianjurensis]